MPECQPAGIHVKSQTAYKAFCEPFYGEWTQISEGSGTPRRLRTSAWAGCPLPHCKFLAFRSRTFWLLVPALSPLFWGTLAKSPHLWITDFCSFFLALTVYSKLYFAWQGFFTIVCIFPLLQCMHSYWKLSQIPHGRRQRETGTKNNNVFPDQLTSLGLGFPPVKQGGWTGHLSRSFIHLIPNTE